MAAERLSMRQIREILRQKWALGLPHRAVAESLGLGLGTISSVLTRAQGAGLDWPQVQRMTDAALESRLYGRPEVVGQRQRPSQGEAGLSCAASLRYLSPQRGQVGQMTLATWLLRPVWPTWPRVEPYRLPLRTLNTSFSAPRSSRAPVSTCQ